MLSAVTTRANDVANYPNVCSYPSPARITPHIAFQPFQGLNPGVFQDSDSKWIELVDGSTNKENIPIGPLLIKARNLDVIVAIDTSADDADNWPVYVSFSIVSRVSDTDRASSEVNRFLQLATVPRKSPPPSPKSSHLSPRTCPTFAVSVSVFVPRSLAVTPRRILQSTLSWFTFPTLLQPMAVTLLPSKLAYSSSTTMRLSLF